MSSENQVQPVEDLLIRLENVLRMMVPHLDHADLAELAESTADHLDSIILDIAGLESGYTLEYIDQILAPDEAEFEDED